MRFTLGAVATGLAAACIGAPAATAATINVPDLQGDFRATNSTVTMTPDGIHFGTYADGGNLGGTAITHLFDGQPLSAITGLSYTFTYRALGEPTDGATYWYSAAPYLRVFLDTSGDGAVDEDVILDPGYCTKEQVAQSTDLTFQMVGNARLRYSDDGCDSLANQATWASIVAAHGSEKIVGILVSQGFSVGNDVSGLLRKITLNGDTYLFGSALQGPSGPAGAAGPAGGTGATGPAGPAGSNGQPGQTVTIIQQVPATTVTATSGSQCRGDSLRTLRIAQRKGWTFVSARAVLRGRSLKISGRTISVDLRGRSESNYNVAVVAKYKRNGVIKTVRTQRNLSVVCA